MEKLSLSQPVPEPHCCHVGEIGGGRGWVGDARMVWPLDGEYRFFGDGVLFDEHHP